MSKSILLTALFITLSMGVFAGNNPAKKDGATGIQFFKGTFKEALAKAKKENKMVMMDCYTTWCGPCKILKSQVFTDKSLGDYMNQKYVCIAVDYENGEGPAVAQQYPVDGYPTLYFLDASGKVKKTLVGVPNPVSSAASSILGMAKKYGK
ncbi:MAG: thioredoxin family protein [Arcicella sp.]|jgi:thiol:disulfide interchange protein|nr:thioredoxin family protein [Arcicella sp.]